MILQLIGIYWVFISIVAIKINLKTFKKLTSYQTQNTDDLQMKGLIRTDFPKWHKRSIIIGSFTILPLRFFFLANFLAGALTIAFIMGLLKDGRLKDNVVSFCIWYFNNYGKLMNNLAIKIEDNCKDIQSQRIKTPIIISNHNCWFDTFYITLKYAPVSFVAKYEIQFWPVIGPLSKAINCIFVKRQNQNDRNTVRDMIKQRIDQFYEGKSNAFPLVIYPEGTTSNNRVILNFKSGAFENMSPITMFCLKYECEDCLLGEDEIQQSEHIFLMLSQIDRLKATKVQMEPEPNENCQQYKQRCRNKMAEILGYPKVNLGYRDRLELEKFRQFGQKLSE